MRGLLLRLHLGTYIRAIWLLEFTVAHNEDIFKKTTVGKSFLALGLLTGSLK